MLAPGDANIYFRGKRQRGQLFEKILQIGIFITSLPYSRYFRIFLLSKETLISWSIVTALKVHWSLYDPTALEIEKTNRWLYMCSHVYHKLFLPVNHYGNGSFYNELTSKSTTLIKQKPLTVTNMMLLYPQWIARKIKWWFIAELDEILKGKQYWSN